MQKRKRFLNYSLILVCLISGFAQHLFAQKNLNPGKSTKRTHIFGGPADRRELRNYGFQFSGGPAYTLTRLHNETIHTQSESGRPVDYVIDPKGRIGVFAEVG